MNPIVLAALFHTASINYMIPQDLLESLCYVESRLNIQAVHHDDGNSDSLGICQVKLETARWLGFKGTATELMVPYNNINYAAKYLQFQIRRYNYSVEKAIVAYNLGSAKQLTKTRYSTKVIKKWRETRNERERKEK